MALLMIIPVYIAMAWLLEPFLLLTFKFLDLVTPKELRFKK